MNYYNENDVYAAQWLRNLIEAGHIATGEVDERDIRDVQPGDLTGYRQCHFFAGIGGWSYALRLAGWPDDRPIWTGSCPCQPFSVAGSRQGAKDERHVWPQFARLIAQCTPAIVFGEQVASADGRAWLGAVRADLEAMGYVVGAADLCAAGVGAPHIRQRLYWLADHASKRWGEGCEVGRGSVSGVDAPKQWLRPVYGSEANRLGYGESVRWQWGENDSNRGRRQLPSGQSSEAGGLSDTDGGNASAERQQCGGEQRQQPQYGGAGGWLANADWLHCSDGFFRPTEPGLQPLAHGVPKRMGKLRAYGNAIGPQIAAEFIAAFDES